MEPHTYTPCHECDTLHPAGTLIDLDGDGWRYCIECAAMLGAMLTTYFGDTYDTDRLLDT